MKNKIMAAALALAPLAAGAESCEGPKPTGLILSIDRPPLAQALGCGNGLWRMSVLNNDIANDPKLTPDQKASKAAKVCLKESDAKKYVVEGQYP